MEITSNQIQILAGRNQEIKPETLSIEKELLLKPGENNIPLDLELKPGQYKISFWGKIEGKDLPRTFNSWLFVYLKHN